MKILITNDDGIESEGLRVAVDFAKTLGDVTVIAPKCEQSGKSHTIEIHKPFEAKKISFFEGAECYTVDSSPADCVRFGLKYLHGDYDLVISGVNNGYNVGEDIMYSGTVGAIFEAASNSRKAIALSTDFYVFTSAREHIAEIYSYMQANRFFDACPIYNINIPLKVNGMNITKQGGAYYKDNIVPRGNDMYFQEGYSVYTDTKDLTIDTDCVMNGYISITPLTICRTDNEAYNKLTKK